MRKPYSTISRRETPRREPTNSGWTKRESMVALVSVIVSAFGVLISAASSLIAWQQVQMLRSERMTPYRAIFYTEKVKSYRDFVSASSEFDTSAISFIMLLDTAKSTDPRDIKDFDDAAARVERAKLGLLNVIGQGTPIWSYKVAVSMQHLSFPISDAALCAEQVRNVKRRNPSELAGIVDRCEQRGTLDSAAYSQRQHATDEAMRDELGAEELKSLPAPDSR